MNIGIFDSGLGGLAIYREIVALMPHYNYVYLGDNARVPYGGRSPKLIYQFTKEAVSFLFQQNCKLIILACNTATANALQRLQQEYLPSTYPDRRILGVIRPIVEAAVEQKAKRVGIIATRATVASNSYPEEIAKLNSSIGIFQNAAPLLVPYIEEGEIHQKEMVTVVKRYLAPLLKKDIDHLILGCTHYSLVEDHFRQNAHGVIVLSQGITTAVKLSDYLMRHPEIDTTIGKNGEKLYFVTDYSKRYIAQMQYFLGNYSDLSVKIASYNR